MGHDTGAATNTRNLDEVTWLTNGVGLVLDTVDGALGPDGQMTATAVRLAMVRRDGTEAQIPGDIGAAQALELARLLMLAAAVVDPALVRLAVDEARVDTLLQKMLQQPLPAGVARH